MIPDPTDPFLPEPHTIAALLAGGDWACAHDEPETLSEVAHLLGRCVPAAQQRELEKIAALANRDDMLAATTSWARLRESLCGRG